jgi:hypothetical protein
MKMRRITGRALLAPMLALRGRKVVLGGSGELKKSEGCNRPHDGGDSKTKHGSVKER